MDTVGTHIWSASALSEATARRPRGAIHPDGDAQEGSLGALQCEKSNLKQVYQEQPEWIAFAMPGQAVLRGGQFEERASRLAVRR